MGYFYERNSSTDVVYLSCIMIDVAHHMSSYIIVVVSHMYTVVIIHCML